MALMDATPVLITGAVWADMAIAAKVEIAIEFGTAVEADPDVFTAMPEHSKVWLAGWQMQVNSGSCWNTAGISISFVAAREAILTKVYDSLTVNAPRIQLFTSLAAARSSCRRRYLRGVSGRRRRQTCRPEPADESLAVPFC
ncbi:MAG: hypothetical protein ABSC06_36850 [Rhodopila sp.]